MLTAAVGADRLSCLFNRRRRGFLAASALGFLSATGGVSFGLVDFCSLAFSATANFGVPLESLEILEKELLERAHSDIKREVVY